MNLCSQEFETLGLDTSLVGRFAFSEEEGNYFEEELKLPGTLESVIEPVKKVRATASYLGAGSWNITLLFPEPIIAKIKSKVGTKCGRGNSLYIEFNQSIDTPDLLKTQESLGYLISRFANGLNTLYLEGKRPLLFRPLVSGNSFSLDIFPNYKLPARASKALQVARSRYLIEARKFSLALHYLYYLNKIYPCDKDILVLLSGLEGLLPRWQRQLAILRTLRAHYPQDEDILLLFKDAYVPHSPYLKVERQLQRTLHFAALQIASMESEQIIDATRARYLYLGESGIVSRGHVKGAVNNQGETVGFLGRRSWGEVYIRNELECGSSYKMSLYGGDGNLFGVGAAAKWLLPVLQGEWGVRAHWHKPFWGTFESFVHYGREDLLQFDINSVYNRYFTWSFGAGMNRVGIDDVSNGYFSVLLSGEAFFYLKITNPVLALNYSLSTDYVTHRATRIGGNGEPFNPVPLTSYENHTIRAHVYYDWRERYHFSAFAGENFNRLGINSPTAGVNFRYIKPCPRSFEVEISAYSFPSTSVVGATAQYITASFTARF